MRPDRYKMTKRYFKNAYHNQKMHMTSIIDRLALQYGDVISIGSGVGAEEILFAQNGVSHISCIEPEAKACQLMDYYIHKYNICNLSLYNIAKEDYHSTHQFNLIYTSSPGDWMNNYTWKDGIPPDYLKFIKRYMAPHGFFIAMIYGGTFHASCKLTRDNQHEFIALLYKQCKENNLYLLEYWSGWANAPSCMVVLSNKYIRLANDVDFTHAFDRWHCLPETKRMYLNGGN